MLDGERVVRSNNVGVGVTADLNGSAVIATPVTLMGNTDGDIVLTLLSGAKILYPRNVGNVIGSVTCDDTSVLAGELTGISTISCKTIVSDKKK